MIAPSLEALTSLLALNKFLFPEVSDSHTTVWQEWRNWHPDLEEIKENYNLKNNDQAKEELLKKINEYKTKVQDHFKLKTFEDYILNMNQHKSFRRTKHGVRTY